MPLTTIRLAAPAHTLGSWPIEVAERRGFFRAQAIMLDRAREASGKLVELLNTRAREVVLVPAEMIVRAARAGQNVVLIGGAVNRAAYSLIAARDVPDIAGLKGKLVGVRDPEDGTAALARAILSARGLGEADYRLIGFEDPAVRAAAIANGTVGASLVDAPRAARLQISGFAVLSHAFEIVPEYQDEALAVRPDWARQNEDALVRFLRAVGQADRWIHEPGNRQEAIDILATTVDLTATEAGRVYEQYVEKVPAIPRAGELDQPGIRSVVELLAEIRAIQRPLPDVATLADTSYLQRARP